MRRFGIAALARLVAGSFLLLAVSATPATAGTPVDPDTLTPPPPPGATCEADGPLVICHTIFNLFATNGSRDELPCGTVYETSTDLRDGIRWYLDGLLIRRLVFQQLDGTWSLSPTGGGPTLTIAAHANWSNRYAVPGDESTGPQINHGVEFTVSAEGFGVIAHIAGLEDADEIHYGAFRFLDAPDVLDRLCDALIA